MASKWEGIKMLISDTFLWDSGFFLLKKNEDNLSKEKLLWCLDVIPLNNADSFYAAR